MRYTIKTLFFVITGLCCSLSVPGAYRLGRLHGARAVFDEIGGPFAYIGSHSGIPLYEENEPSAILWIEQNIQAGKKRHMTIRKPGCGAHWWDAGEINVSGLSFDDNPDYLKDLLMPKK